MPNFGVPQAGGNSNPSLNVTALYPGSGTYYLFNAESPAAGQASVVIERGKQGSDDAGTTFQIEYAAAPTATLAILGSNDPNCLAAFNLEQWMVLYQSVDKQVDSYTDTARWRFYTAYPVSESAGYPVSVIAQR